MNNESNNGSLFPSRSSLLRNVLWIAAAALIYFGVARFSLLLIFQPQGITVIWPTSGIFLSAILLTRRELRPWLVGVLFVTDFIAERLAGTPGLVSLFFALALTADAVLSSWLLLHFVGGRITFKRTHELAGWLLLSVIFSNALSSLVAAAVASRFLPETSFWNFWGEWAVSDGIGNLIITPLILSWAAWGKIRLGSWKLKRVMEGAVLVILLALLNYIAFVRLSEYGLFSLLLSYLTFPFLLWAAWRFGVRGASSTTLVLAAIAIYFAFTGHFVNVLFHDSPLQAVIAVQLYLAILAVPALFLATVLTERNKTEERIKKVNRLYRVLSNINQAIVRLREPEALYREACHIAVEQGGFRMAWIGFLDEETEKVKPVASAGIMEDYLDKLDVTVRDEERGCGPSGTALRSGHYQICNDIEREVWMQPWRADALRLGYRSSAGFPLRVAGNVRGAITLYASEPNFFDEAEIKLLEELAQDISFAMEFAEQEQQRKQMEEKLKGEQILLRTLIDNLPDVIYVKDVLGRKIIANIADWQASGGKAMEDVVGKTDFELYPTKMAEGFWAIDKQVLDSGKAVINLEEPGFDSQGNPVWVLTSKMPLHDSLGNIIGLVGVGRDITERKRAEEALSESEKEFHLLAEAMPQIVWVTRPDGSSVYSNQLWADYTGLTLEQSYGDGWNTVFHPDDQQRAWDAWQNAIRNGTTYSLECRLRRADGVYRWWLIRGVPFLNVQGNILKWFGTCTDIHEIKLAEAKIHELNTELEQRVEERTHELHQAQEELVRKEKLAVLGQLAGGVGHELRNPLAVINNSVYYLKLIQPDADEKIKKHHAMIVQEVHNAAQIVSDLLDYARVISTDRKPVSVPELVEHTLSRFPVPTSIQVSLKIPAGLPQVYSDPLHAEQVLGNLVTNACQAMRDGGNLTISARRQKQMVSITVKDTGIGISPENMEKLFQPLFTTKPKGIGLGLAVSKKLAEANGGRIEVESELGKGSIFTIFLPEKL